MAYRVTAIYEDGALRPLFPLELPEHSQVEIDIHHSVERAGILSKSGGRRQE
jgi:predicted DNA-binding antitoxin AbrB/MazE fold protein